MEVIGESLSPSSPVVRIGAPHPSDKNVYRVIRVFIYELASFNTAHRSVFSSRFAALMISPDRLLVGIDVALKMRNLDRFYGDNFLCFRSTLKAVQDLRFLRPGEITDERELEDLWEGLTKKVGDRAGESSKNRQRPPTAAQMVKFTLDAVGEARGILQLYAKAGQGSFFGRERSVSFCGTWAWTCPRCTIGGPGFATQFRCVTGYCPLG